MITTANGPTIARVASLVGDVARATILAALMSGKALTAGELARLAGVTPQTSSGHLAKLLEAGLVEAERQGRFHYYRLASSDVADALEALSILAASQPTRYFRPGPKDEELRLARTCYDHVAGKLGLAIADALQEREAIIIREGSAFVTNSGHDFLVDFGVDIHTGRSAKPLCKTCLDWSERRHHFAGRVGTSLLNRMLDLKWIKRVDQSRALHVSPAGEQGLLKVFGVRVRELRN
ncbi:helix-turn-helix transcriptional regulator [Agrobacterium sp. a22-2]|uniref:ArsR/SmtB family transcription factor n=1 Tax=Agrobacterium sp. a22-2 TaxID=2283840 RepID=UPI00144791DF|nr:helix-turn-helix domain-containing protein [Agrobacterium sp. a22-2]NKN39001.1 helix-turn-helix transcriptional regulator [Agrobacterium sp. a22-2]